MALCCILFSYTDILKFEIYIGIQVFFSEGGDSQFSVYSFTALLYYLKSRNLQICIELCVAPKLVLRQGRTNSIQEASLASSSHENNW